MSRITGTDAFNMMEAYNAVYAPQELTEEQVQEDFENWVNSLVEEGYDLSEYTWEDMYEEYISEIPINPTGNRPISNAPYQSRFARPMNAGTPQTYGGGRVQPRTVRPPVASLPSSARQVTQYPQGVSTGVGGGNAGASRQAPAARPASPAPAAARPAAAPARPSAAPIKPATASVAPAGKSRPNAPTRPATPSYSGATGVRPVGTPLPTGAVTPVAGAPAQNATVSAPASRPSLAAQAAELRAMRKASQQRIIAQGGTPATPLVQSFDPFDIVMGYLIDEGYAETEEAAAVIMANMSEEWREEILDEEVRGAKKGTIRSVIEKGGKSIKYVQSGGDIVTGDRAAAERASAADRKRSGRNRANAARAEQARKKSIQNLNAKSGEDSGDYDSGHYGDDDTSDGKRHYSLSHTNRDARRRRASDR